MRPSDPTAPETRRISVAPAPISVEEVARAQAATSARADPTPERPTPATAAPPADAAAGPRQPVSGRYRSAGHDFQLELRVDVDGRIPLRCMSGDFYKVDGSTTRYFGSFRVNSPDMRVTPDEVEIEGVGLYTWRAGFPKVRVTIARVPDDAPAGRAAAQFMALEGGPGERYECAFESPFFRTIEYEQDALEGVTPFQGYDTSTLPSGGPPRVLTVESAFAEAGIEIRWSGETTAVSVQGGGSEWSNAELHSAMERWFSLYGDDPGWRVWLLAANRHVDGPTVRGVMFDRQGRPRQGCAVFHDALGTATPADVRGQLRTYVHEIGHCFNLAHAWIARAAPPLPSRPRSLTYMNYPHQYVPGGETSFWPAFPFSFDYDELMHLRHGARNDVIMGSEEMQAVVARDSSADALDAAIADTSGLDLRVEAPPSFAYSEPVVVTLRLSTTRPEGASVHQQIHPKLGFTQVLIQTPSGRVRRYEPFMSECAESALTTITPDRSVYESAYIGYGRAGFYFDEPGLYDIRAVYRTLDGSLIVSNRCRIRIRTPLSEADEMVADKFLNEDQGALFFLLGSQAEELRSGTAGFDEVIDRFPNHRLTAYARLVNGWVARREFKTVSRRPIVIDETLGRRRAVGEVDARPRDLTRAVDLLSAAVESARQVGQIDNITLNMMMRGLAGAKERQGDTEGAQRTLVDMVATFEQRKLKPSVLETIRSEATAL